MTDAKQQLAASRQAILEHVARRQRRHDPREEDAATARAEAAGAAAGAEWAKAAAREDARTPPPRPGSGWMGRVQHAVQTWWRYHPAHMAVDLAAPLMHDYARRKPVQLLALSAATGAVLTLARPWRVISVTTLLVAVLKSSQLPNVLMAAMSAADFEKDHHGPR